MDWLTAEREKYYHLWEQGDYTSNSAINYANELIGKVGGYVLEIGCGKGVSMDILNKQRGVKCTGVDITLNGYEGDAPVFEAPVWEMPFPDKCFDYSFSTDVMEHIPMEMIEKSLKEIDRVTRHKTFHFISTKVALTKYKGEQVHLIVKPDDWWMAQFGRMCGIEAELKFW